MMKKKALCQWALILLMAPALLLVGCRSSKRAVQEGNSATAPATDATTGASPSAVTVQPATGEDSGKAKKGKKGNSVVARINSNRQTARGIRGKMNLTLRTGSSPLSASGTIKMKRDEIIQISITALGLLELGRMELTPEYLFIQDRYHKRYIKANWNDIPSLQSAGIDFTALQAFFWNELYVPGSRALPTDDDYEHKSVSPKICLQPKLGQQVMEALFYTNDSKELVQQTSLVARNGKMRFDGLCRSWTRLDGKQFPADMYMAFSVGDKGYTLELTFTRLQVDEAMGDITTSLSDGKYTRVELGEILKGLHL